MITKISKAEAWVILRQEALTTLSKGVASIIDHLEPEQKTEEEPHMESWLPAFNVYEQPVEREIISEYSNDDMIYYSDKSVIRHCDFQNAYVYRNVIIISGNDIKRAFMRHSNTRFD